MFAGIAPHLWHCLPIFIRNVILPWKLCWNILLAMYASSIWHMHVITLRWSRLDESRVVLLFLSVSSSMYFTAANHVSLLVHGFHLL